MITSAVLICSRRVWQPRHEPRHIMSQSNRQIGRWIIPSRFATSSTRSCPRVISFSTTSRKFFSYRRQRFGNLFGLGSRRSAIEAKDGKLVPRRCSISRLTNAMFEIIVTNASPRRSGDRFGVRRLEYLGHILCGMPAPYPATSWRQGAFGKNTEESVPPSASHDAFVAGDHRLLRGRRRPLLVAVLHRYRLFERCRDRSSDARSNGRPNEQCHRHPHIRVRSNADG